MREPCVLLFGATGMLGREIASACRRRGVPLVTGAGRRDCDITNLRDVRDVLDELRPTMVINAAGYTDIDGAETDFESALETNGIGVGHLAHACRSTGALLVHFSTDLVFSGDAGRRYHPSDEPDPINSYGLSKLAGEQAILASGCEYLIIRSGWLYAPHGRNFVRFMLHAARQRDILNMVDDQYGQPTSCADLAVMTLRLIAAAARRTERKPMRGVYHAANGGACTWCDFARAIVKMAGIACEVHPCSTSAALRPAPRPHDCVLDLSETSLLIGPPRHWRDALRECVEQIESRRLVTSDVR